MTGVVLKALVVDDEALARARMRTLLGDCKTPTVHCVGEAANAVQAMEMLQHQAVDVALLDIHMPGADGLALAQSLQSLSQPPALIFVTAHAEHAVRAFDLEAVDYLTKPVRLERLQQALQKVERYIQSRRGLEANLAQDDVLIIQERGRTERIPLQQILYFKAELKYVTVRTASRSYILDGSLNELEEKHRADFVRIHRNALIARRAVRALEKHFDAEEGEGWAVRLNGVDELLAVSRRQLAAVRELVSR
ncbi:response regulator transcription factor [Rhodoferax sp. AJA081-3]|jgi:two-component system response regulator AlgR|uniref:LytR/AlgR family response regulator transcription factor n=1 Tax=Rhodoferax sp. AJA081-3 TaxID=2752316 RepID=UPI001AE00D11|nr:LytTR family DNA-binding domain-containing protein [Rhodoferax sp. AJA081-3]QTN29813.1 response regulator transcription factor [Rhodoferax sp. AJA081-3]